MVGGDGGARGLCNMVGGRVACVVRGTKDSKRDKNRKVEGDRPMTTTKKALRAALRATSTSGKVLPT